ncbi:MAG: hypothetical protein ACKOF3_09610, partial [Spartobacteria bacterium]
VEFAPADEGFKGEELRHEGRLLQCVKRVIRFVVWLSFIFVKAFSQRRHQQPGAIPSIERRIARPRVRITQACDQAGFRAIQQSALVMQDVPAAITDGNPKCPVDFKITGSQRGDGSQHKT